MQRAATLCFNLYFTGFHQEVQVRKGFRYVFASGQNTVIAQHHHGVIPEIPDQAFTLIQVQSNTFIIVVTQMR